MITIEQAKALEHGDILHHNTNKNADSTCQRWRVTGKVKTWKRDLTRVKVPVKYGMYTHDYVTEYDLDKVSLEKECLNCREVV